MAKLFGLSGRVTGRKGDTVFSVRKGEQIIRQYNPMVLNPNTEAQTVQRAKMKLASQLGSVFANIIAIPSEGAKTSRNIFTTQNFGLITRSSDPDVIKVDVDLSKIQLTKSGRAMAPIAAARTVNEGKIFANVTRNVSTLYDRVVYAMLAVQANGSMRVLKSQVIREAGTLGNFPVSFTDPGVNVVIYAYGIKDLKSSAATTFDNTQYEDGSDIASLISGRVVSAADAQVTRTVGVMLLADASAISSDGLAAVRCTLQLSWDDNEEIELVAVKGNIYTLTAETDETHVFESFQVVGGDEPYQIGVNPFNFSPSDEELSEGVVAIYAQYE